MPCRSKPQCVLDSGIPSPRNFREVYYRGQSSHSSRRGIDDEDLKIGKEGFAVVVVVVIEELPKLLVKDVDE